MKKSKIRILTWANVLLVAVLALFIWFFINPLEGRSFAGEGLKNLIGQTGVIILFRFGCLIGIIMIIGVICGNIFGPVRDIKKIDQYLESRDFEKTTSIKNNTRPEENSSN